LLLLLRFPAGRWVFNRFFSRFIIRNAFRAFSLRHFHTGGENYEPELRVTEGTPRAREHGRRRNNVNP
jgi:hypothetical protein